MVILAHFWSGHWTGPGAGSKVRRGFWPKPGQNGSKMTHFWSKLIKFLIKNWSKIWQIFAKGLGFLVRPGQKPWQNCQILQNLAILPGQVAAKSQNFANFCKNLSPVWPRRFYKNRLNFDSFLAKIPDWRHFLTPKMSPKNDPKIGKLKIFRFLGSDPSNELAFASPFLAPIRLDALLGQKWSFLGPFLTNFDQNPRPCVIFDPKNGSKMTHFWSFLTHFLTKNQWLKT